MMKPPKPLIHNWKGENHFLTSSNINFLVLSQLEKIGQIFLTNFPVTTYQVKSITGDLSSEVRKEGTLTLEGALSILFNYKLQKYLKC